MAFKHKCKKCGKIIEYETQEELKKFFYIKGGYVRGVCIDCEKEEHKIKYHNGTYNYYHKRDLTNNPPMKIGIIDRSYN